MTHLCGKLSAAVEDIRAQEVVMTKLMNLKEVCEDRSSSTRDGKKTHPPMNYFCIRGIENSWIPQ